MLDLNTQIYNIDGSESFSKLRKTVMKEVNGELVETQALEDKAVTLGAMLTHSVLKTMGDTSVGVVTQKYNLFKKLNVPEVDGKKLVELDDNDKEFLKTLVCDSLEIFYAGQILELLN